jgi:hypothetical protein
MTPITDEQAILLRQQRSWCYELQRRVLHLAVALDAPECPHQKHEEDLQASRDCEYCGVLMSIRSAVREMEATTELLDKALLNGPIVK